MPDFQTRSPRKELLDQAGIPFHDILLNMHELDIINRYLGGHAISCNGLEILLSNRKNDKAWIICEIGCGNGNNIAALHRWCQRNDINAKFIGIDISAACVDAANKSASAAYTEYHVADYRNMVFEQKPDIIFSSLFCHHFDNEALKDQMRWLRENTKLGFFINDLHRNPLAYYSIRVLTRFFSKSYLVKNDAPISVLRGFKKEEWSEILGATGFTNFSIKWKWAFRWLIVIVN